MPNSRQTLRRIRWAEHHVTLYVRNPLTCFAGLVPVLYPVSPLSILSVRIAISMSVGTWVLSHESPANAMHRQHGCRLFALPWRVAHVRTLPDFAARLCVQRLVLMTFDVLGRDETDIVPCPCNRRHHQLAFVQVSFATLQDGSISKYGDTWTHPIARPHRNAISGDEVNVVRILHQIQPYGSYNLLYGCRCRHYQVERHSHHQT